jgi:hypothetical protein
MVQKTFLSFTSFEEIQRELNNPQLTWQQALGLLHCIRLYFNDLSKPISELKQAMEFLMSWADHSSLSNSDNIFEIYKGLKGEYYGFAVREKTLAVLCSCLKLIHRTVRNSSELDVKLDLILYLFSFFSHSLNIPQNKPAFNSLAEFLYGIYRTVRPGASFYLLHKAEPDNKWVADLKAYENNTSIKSKLIQLHCGVVGPLALTGQAGRLVEESDTAIIPNLENHIRRTYQVQTGQSCQSISEAILKSIPFGDINKDLVPAVQVYFTLCEIKKMRDKN